MTTKLNFLILSVAGLLAFTIFSVPSSHRLITADVMADRSGPNQTSAVGAEINQSTQKTQLTPLTVAEPQREMASFELIENKFAQLNPNQVQEEVRRIDSEAQKVSLKNFNDFSTEERVTFFNRQREKAVLLNKIILARLERFKK